MRYGVIALTLISGAACGPPSMQTTPSSASRCTESVDCAGYEECFRGVCVPTEDNNEGCVAASDCRNGETCRHGLCVSSSDQCRYDNDCSRGQVCDNGQCIQERSGCTSHGDCAEGQTCRNGQCITSQNRNNDCQTDGDCAAGQACRNGRCITQQSGGGGGGPSSGTPCQTHDECGAGEACLQPQGTCGRWLGERCRSDVDCSLRDSQGTSTPGLCDQGQCRVNQFGNCQADADCGGTYNCMTAGRYRMCLQGCQDSSVCDSNLKCDDEISACWYNLCGQPHELSDRYQQIDNGHLGGTCDADGDGDGTCVEVPAGNDQWVGLCVEGGNARVGDSCLFETERADDRNQCQGGALCHFDNDRTRGVCVSSCSPDNGHGSVRCRGNTTCMAGRCLSPEQQCDPGAANACGSMGRCSLLSWAQDRGMCNAQEPNPVAPGQACEKSTQCIDGSLCLTLRRGEQAPTCHTLCRPRQGGGNCPSNTRCTSLSELSGGQITSNWGLCAPATN